MSEILNPIRNDSTALPKILSSLKTILGAKLTTLILGIDSRTLNKWIREEEKPLDYQRRLIYSTAYVVDILSSYLPKKEVRLWLVSDSEYLYGIPAMELRSRPEDVQYAALNRISRGEYYDLLNDRLQDTISPESESRR